MVYVLVSPYSYPSMKASYAQLTNVQVRPLRLSPQDLTISTMLTLMSVDSMQAVPLYMGAVTKILRDMASQTAGNFDYHEFRRRLKDAGLDGKQEYFLAQRLDILESFLDFEESASSPAFLGGELTIIDLSCPFVDSNLACIMFKTVIDLFLESDTASGKVLVLDEAHKVCFFT